MVKEFIPAGDDDVCDAACGDVAVAAFTMFFDDPACLPPLPAQESQSEEPFYPRELERYSVERPPLRLFAGYAKTWAEKVAIKGARWKKCAMASVCGESTCETPREPSATISCRESTAIGVAIVCAWKRSDFCHDCMRCRE